MAKQKWSPVTEASDAFDLESGTDQGRRRKSTPFQSAMSMLTFFKNRAGRRLPAHRKRVLEEAREELRRAFERD